METGDHFLNITLVAQKIKTTINKWDLLKLRSFCKGKHNVNKTKTKAYKMKKIFTNPTPDRGLTYKIYKEQKKVNIKRQNNLIKNEIQI